MRVQIASLPSRGQLYDVSSNVNASRALPIDSAGQELLSDARYVLYMPDQDKFGKPFDSFRYVLSVGSGAGALESVPATVTVNVEGSDDLPTVNGSSFALVEDMLVREGVLVTLAASDAEVGTPLEIMIVNMPEKGTLYQASERAHASARTPGP